MTSIAAQVVLHPTISRGLKFGGTTVGRDKAYRALQYLSRFFAWYFDKKRNKLEAARWAALKAHLGLARKLIRLGKPMDHLQAALRASLSNAPPLETLTAIAKQLGYFAFLSYDAIVWAQAVRIINLSKETASKIQRRSFQFWFAGIVFSLFHGGLKSARLAKELKALMISKTWGEKDLAEEATRETKLSGNMDARKSNQQQIVLDLLDIWIPAAGAGFLNINEGVLGLVGLISSIIGAKAQWEAINSKH